MHYDFYIFCLYEHNFLLRIYIYISYFIMLYNVTYEGTYKFYEKSEFISKKAIHFRYSFLSRHFSHHI